MHFGATVLVKSLQQPVIPMEEIRLLDPELATFTNINKIEDLRG